MATNIILPKGTRWNSTFKVKFNGKPIKRSGFKTPSKTRLKPRTAKLPKKPTISKLKKQLWQITRELAFKLYGSDCYTCEARNLVGSNRHLGHFIPSSVCSAEIRYSLDNLRPSCYRCNIHLSGNWIAYEQHLIKDGIDVVALKQKNRDTKGMQADSLFYLNKIAEYTALLAELEGNIKK